jgi:hypothetical protein
MIALSSVKDVTIEQDKITYLLKINKLAGVKVALVITLSSAQGVIIP